MILVTHNENEIISDDGVRFVNKVEFTSINWKERFSESKIGEEYNVDEEAFLEAVNMIGDIVWE